MCVYRLFAHKKMHQLFSIFSPTIVGNANSLQNLSSNVPMSPLCAHTHARTRTHTHWGQMEILRIQHMYTHVSLVRANNWKSPDKIDQPRRQLQQQQFQQRQQQQQKDKRRWHSRSRRGIRIAMAMAKEIYILSTLWRGRCCPPWAT